VVVGEWSDGGRKEWWWESGVMVGGGHGMRMSEIKVGGEEIP